MAKRGLNASFPGGDRFELLGELGRGGMGVVYDVRDRERGVRLALKGLRRVGPRAILRLKHEFRAIADLQHPNLIRLHELGFKKRQHVDFDADECERVFKQVLEDLAPVLLAEDPSLRPRIEAALAEPSRPPAHA